MITSVDRTKLDVARYDHCIKSAKSQNGAYAISWFLDIVCDDWDTLVLNDYEAVMPLPKRKKYFIHYIYTPCFTQQLGIFSSKKVDQKLLEDFIKSIPSKFKSIAYNFNNIVISNNVIPKKNLVIDLNQDYQDIYKKYKRGRKYQLKLSQKQDLIIKACPPNLLIEYFKKDKAESVSYTPKDYEKLSMLMNYCTKEDKGIVYGVFNKTDDTFLGGSFFMKSPTRIIYLFSTVTHLGRKLNIITLLINHMLSKHSKSNLLFDFEGSMIPGIASFFESFGSKPETYYLFHKKFSLL